LSVIIVGGIFSWRDFRFGIFSGVIIAAWLSPAWLSPAWFSHSTAEKTMWRVRLPYYSGRTAISQENLFSEI